jgi:hypothetical protein
LGIGACYFLFPTSYFPPSAEFLPCHNTRQQPKSVFLQNCCSFIRILCRESRNLEFPQKDTLISIGDVNCHSSYIPHKFTASFASRKNLWRSGTQKQVFDRKIATKTINIGLTQIIILNFKANLTPAKTGVLTWDELDFSIDLLQKTLLQESGKGKRLKGKGKIQNLYPFPLPLFPTYARSLMSGFLKSAQDVIYNLPPRVDALQTLCFA